MPIIHSCLLKGFGVALQLQMRDYVACGPSFSFNCCSDRQCGKVSNLSITKVAFSHICVISFQWKPIKSLLMMSGHFDQYVSKLFLKPHSHPNGFYWVTNAHGPSPQQTACRSPPCSLTTATGSYQVQSNLLCQNFISFSLNNSFNSKSQNWEYFCWAFLLLLSRSKGCNMFDLSVTALFYSVYIHVGKLGFIICMH